MKYNADGHDDVWLGIITDMSARRRQGLEHYGVPLGVANGHDSNQDALEEALDLVVYLKKQQLELKLLRQRLLFAARMPNVETMRTEILDAVQKYLLVDGHRLDEKAALGELPQREKEEEADAPTPVIMPIEVKPLELFYPLDNRVENQMDWDVEGDADE